MSLTGALTCQAGQNKLGGALVQRFVVVAQHSEGKTAIEQGMSSDDTQVV